MVSIIVSTFENDKEKFDNYKNQVIQKIINFAQEKGFSEIDDYRRRVEKDIEKLTTSNNNNQNDTNTGQANSDENENSETDNNSSNDTEEPNNDSNSSNQTNIKVLKQQVISAIKAALTSPEPKLTNSDLDLEKAKQTSQKVDDDLKKARDPKATTQDKKDALDELDKNEGEQSYEDKKEQIKEAKKEVAKDNPNEYRNKVISNLDKKLAENGLSESDLDEQTRQEIKDLKNGGNLEPDKLVELEMKLTEKIGQAGAKKKVDNLAGEVEKVLKNKEKAQVEKLKKELLEILNSSNVYYFPHKSQVEKLLKQLESVIISDKNSLQPANSLPLLVKIGIGAVIILVVGFFGKGLMRYIVGRSEYLYKTSGHLDHYQEYMFPEISRNNETFYLRPMTCPHHCIIYQQKPRSYRDLPFRLCENSLLFRYEASGALKGLERPRWFELADHHIFVSPEQLKEELKKNYLYIVEGEAAFYGPKLDLEITAADGKNITISTIQLDFILPQKFAPCQVAILPFNEEKEIKDYCEELAGKLKQSGLRVKIFTKKKLKDRIRQMYQKKIPYYLVIGQEEVAAKKNPNQETKMKLMHTYEGGKAEELTEKELFIKL
ncbi:314_t:CDS:2 [Cetraspora pellucida]|uniref:314_t:CDS:1 n=1 Tax=Cetraspora pellucida TaxID=1433469 RepID=A0ACA9LUW1_9GLOM|nr:314_t:CDS:2 [Cetraspora pellucida]